MKLQEIAVSDLVTLTKSGLTKEEPLYNNLGIVDEYCKVNWKNIRMTGKELTDIFLESLYDGYDILEKRYQEKNEPEFALLVNKIRQVKSLKKSEISIMICFLMANIETIKRNCI